MNDFEDLLNPPVLHRSREVALRRRLDGLAKPPGSLGRIEELAVDLALAQGRDRPTAARPVLLIFAGDHGLTRSGVSAYPAAVTRAMTETLLDGRASANAFACAVGAHVRVIDAGVAGEPVSHPELIGKSMGPGTGDASRGPAMTPEQAREALLRGAAVAGTAIASGADLILLGEMGIGNSASAALLMNRLGPAPLDDCIGPGAGHSPEGMARKRAVLARAAARVGPCTPLETLAEFGGFEIAMQAGALLGAARSRTPTVIDGFISSAAALAAIRLAPQVRDYCIFAHCSAEPGHRHMLELLNARPMLSLDMRLGEGTGALLAVPIIRAACALMGEVATLQDVLERAR